MWVNCNKCSGSFEVDEKKIAPAGSKISCKHCKETLTVTPGGVAAEDEMWADGVDVTKTMTYTAHADLADLLAQSAGPEAMEPREETVVPSNYDPGAISALPALADDGITELPSELFEDALETDDAAKEFNYDPNKGPLGTRIVKMPEGFEETFRPATLVIDKPKSRYALIFNSVVVFLAMIGVTAGGIISSSNIQKGEGIVALDADTLEQAKLADISVQSAKAVRYPTAHGEVLLVYGKAKNGGDNEVKNIYLAASIKNHNGRILGSAKGPIGLGLSPFDIHELTDPSSVKAAFKKASEGHAEIILKPGQVGNFTAVMLNPPRHLGSLVPMIVVEQGKALYTPPPPPPAIEELPPPKKKKRRRRRKAAAETP